MFFVVEIQNNNGKWSQIITQHPTQAEAESKFYNVLSYAAVSDLTAHGAVMFDDKCVYNHKVYDRSDS